MGSAGSWQHAVPRERSWRPAGPLALHATLGPLVRGTGDPAHRRDAAGAFWRACATPDGPVTLRLAAAGDGTVRASAWGPGADWQLAAVPDLLGVRDDWSDLDVSAVVALQRARQRHPGVRLGRTGLVLDALLPAALEQRVTGLEARRAWRGLLRRHGTPAPGPLAELRVPPDPATLLAVPTWDWRRLGVDLARQRAIRAAATVASRLEECAGMSPIAAAARLRGVPGIGPWTSAEVLQRALGDPDAISVGDYHIPAAVVHFFTGRRGGTDAEMIELLRPWAGQRQRVVRLIELSGVTVPRRGPRRAVPDPRAS